MARYVGFKVEETSRAVISSNSIIWEQTRSTLRGDLEGLRQMDGGMEQASHRVTYRPVCIVRLSHRLKISAFSHAHTRRAVKSIMGSAIDLSGSVERTSTS